MHDPATTVLSFGANATVKNNNLGGFDPLLPATLLYGNVGTVQATGQTLDLEVTNTSLYRPWRTIRTGLNGEFAQINLDAPKSGAGEELNYVTLLMRLLDASTGAPVVLDRFHMSFYDFDEGVDGNGRECFSTRGYTRIQVSESTTQIVDGVDSVDSSFTSFCGSQTGALSDNPTSPFALTEHQRSKSIEVTYQETSQVEMRF